MSASPIFIGGLSQSGKTPLRRALGTDPQVMIRRHSGLFDHLYGRFGDLSRQENARRAVAAVADLQQWSAIDQDQLLDRFARGPASYPHLFGLVHQLEAERLGKSRWGEQLGLIERFAPSIFAAYPHATFIHMIRDPRQRAANRSQLGRIGWETGKWITSAHLAIRNQTTYPGNYQIVRFENLAADPAAVLHSVCRLAGLVYTAEMLAEWRQSLPVMSTDNAPIRFIERYAGKQLDSFGYSSSPQAENGLRYYMLDWPANRVAMSAWNWHQRQAEQQEVVA